MTPPLHRFSILILMLASLRTEAAPAAAGSLDDITELGDLATAGPHQVAVFRDTHFGDNTGVLFNYQLGGRPSAQLIRLHGRAAILQSWKLVPWNIVNWHWMNSTARVFAQDLPNLASREARASATTDAATLSVDWAGRRAETLTIARDHVALQLDSTLYYQKLFGGLFFPASDQVTWPLLGLNHNFAFRHLSDYSALNFTLTAHLRAAAVNRTQVTTPGPIPAGATTAYNHVFNATRLEFSLPLRWHPRNLAATDPLHKYFNKPINLLIFFYDDRWEYWDPAKPPIRADPGTANFGHVFIYRLGIRDLIPGRPEKNPFKIVGAAATVQADILPLLKTIILTARQKSDADKIDYVPPRRQINGTMETDDQYFGDFTINSYGLTYENSGLANLDFDFDKISFVGTRR